MHPADRVTARKIRHPTDLPQTCIIGQQYGCVMIIRPILYTKEEIQERYSYDGNHPLVLRWKKLPGARSKQKIGDIATIWNGKSRHVATSTGRTTPLSWAVWMYVHGTRAPLNLRPRPERPDDFRIENLFGDKQRQQTKEERRASNIAHLTAWKNSHTPEEWRQRCRDMHIKKTFAMSPADFARMLDAQKGVCGICQRSETASWRGRTKTLAVDHCHNSKEVRGLLCNNCNNMLGRAKDDPAVLRAAANYLEQWPDIHTRRDAANGIHGRIPPLGEG